MGKSAILVSHYGQLGGMTSSGLGWSDIGNDASSADFRASSATAITALSETGGVETGEPRKVSQPGPGSARSQSENRTGLHLRTEGCRGHGRGGRVRVIEGRLDFQKGAAKNGARITGIRLEDGRIIQGKVFIDASHEGDLLDAAGVSFVAGREANSEFNEKCNGITGPLPKNQLPKGIDPCVVAGDPSNGLLPGVNRDMGTRLVRAAIVCRRTATAWC